MKNIFLLFFCLFFSFAVVAQTDTTEEEWLDDVLGFTEEEIRCEDLADIFIEYSGSVQLLESAFKKSLYNMSHFVTDIDKKNKISKSDLQDQKTQIDEAKKIIDRNSYQMSEQSSNILYLLRECLNQSSF